MVVNKLDDQAIFEVARQIGSHEARQAYLTQVCGADLATAERIDALLRAHDECAWGQIVRSGKEAERLVWRPNQKNLFAPGGVNFCDSDVGHRPGN